MTTPIATDPLATVPVEEHPRILEAAQDERDAAYAKWIADDEPIVACEKASERAYLDTIAREVAAWHARQRPPVTPGFVDLESSDIATPETLTRAETCNCGHEKAAHAAAGHGACTAVLGEDARCVCRGYSRSDAIPETLTREEAIVAASHLSPAASSMIDLTDPRACLRSFESLRSAPPDFWKARDIVVAYVAHLDRLAAASPEQIAKDHAVGLYRKFDVRRTDGSSDPGGKHEDCEYFVLDWQHDPFTVPAVRAYADACEATYPALAADLRAKAESIAAAPPPIGPAARLTEEELAEIEARTADPPLAGDGPALRRLVAEVRALRAAPISWGAAVAIAKALCAEGDITQQAAAVVRIASRRAEQAVCEQPAAEASEEARATQRSRLAVDLRDIAAWHERQAEADPSTWELHTRAASKCYTAADRASRGNAPQRPGLTEEQAREDYLSALRGQGWTVAVHNDYRLNGEARTFWLFTKGSQDGGMRAVKGEGATDEEALAECVLKSGDLPRLTGAILRASRGEASPAVAGHDANEGLGPEPGILAPAASDAGPPPAPADHVSIPRAVLERLVEATCYAPNVRVEREIARRALQLDLMRPEVR